MTYTFLSVALKWLPVLYVLIALYCIYRELYAAYHPYPPLPECAAVPHPLLTAPLLHQVRLAAEVPTRAG